MKTSRSVASAIVAGLVMLWGASARAGLFQDAGTFGTASLGVPSGISVDSQGVTYITDFANNSIKVFDAGHNFVGTLGIGTLISPSAIVAAPNGTLYVGDVSRVLPLSKAGIAGTPIAPSTFNGIYGITADSASNLFVADVSASTIRTYSAGGAAGFTIATANGLALKNPFGVALDATHLYVADTFNDRLVTFDLSGNYLSSFNPVPAGWNDHPSSIAVLNGVLYVTINHVGTAAWTPDGQLLETTTASAGAMAVFGDSLYSMDSSSHTVHIFQAPEPTSLSLLAVGGAGLLWRRRKVGTKA